MCLTQRRHVRGTALRVPRCAAHPGTTRHGAPPARPRGVTLDRVLREAAPAAERLVLLLAPWERAWLRLVCRTLAEAVPAAACAPSLSSMVRSGGAALLRYGAGDARPCWAHALVAVEADAADALRWMLDADTGLPEVRRHARLLGNLAMRVGSAGAWRLLNAPIGDPLPSSRSPAAARHGRNPVPTTTMMHGSGGGDDGGDDDEPTAKDGKTPAGPRSIAQDLLCYYRRHMFDYPDKMLMDAMRGGSESIAAEIAAAMADQPSYLGCCMRAIDEVPRYDMPAVLEPFLRLGPGHALHRKAALAAFVMGRRAPPDSDPHLWGHPIDLGTAVRAGDVALADALLRGRVGRPCHGSELLADAVRCRRNTSAVLEWATSVVGTEPLMHQWRIDKLLACAINEDACDALRWITDLVGAARLPRALDMAIYADAAECAKFLIGQVGHLALCSFVDATRQAKHRVATVLAAHLGPLDAETFVRLARTAAKEMNEADTARMMAMLRRRKPPCPGTLLPAPGTEFLDACIESLHGRKELGVLVMAGYRVDADACAWLESLRPHCAYTPDRRWRRVALDLHARWHACYGWIASPPAGDIPT